MQVLVTAGNTQAPIDRVRCITNIFTGRTGAAIAIRASQMGHDVTLLTSHPETAGNEPPFSVRAYRTFAELQAQMAERITGESFDAVIHCAAVSDYLPAGVFAADRTTPLPPVGKMKSDAQELWLKLVRTPKLIDSVRSDWGFRGVLVKFKLEVGISDKQLIAVAEQSRRQSDADLMVANTLEGSSDCAYLGPLAGRYERIPRADLPERLLEAIAAIHEGRRHG